MDQNEYPRPDYTPSGPYAKDRTWGIVIIVLSSLLMCCGLGMAGLGGLLGVAGAGAAASGSGSRDAAAGLGVGGGIVALIGFAMMASSALQIAGGIGILNSRRWGFILTGALSVISILLGIARLPQGIVGIVINAIIVYYCWARLSGKEGPTPV